MQKYTLSRKPRCCGNIQPKSSQFSTPSSTHHGPLRPSKSTYLVSQGNGEASRGPLLLGRGGSWRQKDSPSVLQTVVFLLRGSVFWAGMIYARASNLWKSGIVSGPNLLSEHFLLELCRGHREKWPPLCAGEGQPEQSVWTLPFAFTLTKDSTIPVQALEIE